MFKFINEKIEAKEQKLFPCAISDLQEQMVSNLHVSLFNWSLNGVLMKPNRTKLSEFCQDKCRYYLQKSTEENEIKIAENAKIDSFFESLVLQVMDKTNALEETFKSTYDKKLNGKKNMINTYRQMQTILELYRGKALFKFINFDVLNDSIEAVIKSILGSRKKNKRKID